MVLGNEGTSSKAVTENEISSNSNSSSSSEDEQQIENITPVKKNISALIVDDDSFIRTINTTYLKSAGITDVVTVQDGKQAVDLHISGASFDLILMDMSMPIMDGPTATRELRAMGVKSVIAGVTAACEKEMEEFVEAGLNVCYSKPLGRKNANILINQFFSTPST